MDVDFYYPCSTIEHLYFLAKYVCYYHLFLLFNHTFEYCKEKVTEKKIKLTEIEKNLYKFFQPVMESLFNIQDHNPLNNQIFLKYYSHNPDELEIIYNQFLLKNHVIEVKYD